MTKIVTSSRTLKYALITLSLAPAFMAMPNNTTDLFCAGSAFLPNGDPLVEGGQQGPDGRGVMDANIYHPFSQSDQSQTAQSVDRQPRDPAVRATTGVQDVVDSARERYAAAEYGEALALLDGVRATDADIPTRVAVEEYRALCLLALGRDDDSKRAIEQLIMLDPTFDIDKLDASPTVKKAFQTVRAELLPTLARGEYETGKAAFDQKSYAEAKPHLQKALSLADMAGPGANDASLNDIKTLARGFLDLTTAAITEAEKHAATAPAPPPAPVRSVSPPRRPVIEEPVALRQEIPMSAEVRRLAGGREGVMELTIDETGQVTKAVMREPIHPVYDAMLLKIALKWRYRPGTVDGKPVPRTLTVVVRPE